MNRIFFKKAVSLVVSIAMLLSMATTALAYEPTAEPDEALETILEAVESKLQASENAMEADTDETVSTEPDEASSTLEDIATTDITPVGPEGTNEELDYWRDDSISYRPPLTYFAPALMMGRARAALSYDAVYEAMIALKDRYPEGKYWDNDTPYGSGPEAIAPYYVFKGGWMNGGNVGRGCAAFVFLLSDAAFGDLPTRTLHNFTYDDVHVGDILRVNNNSHFVIVLRKGVGGVVIAEANFNKSVHWGRTMSVAEVLAADFLGTRYPANYVPSDDPTANDITYSGINDSPSWTLTKSGTLTISGSGPMPNFAASGNNTPPWSQYSSLIDTVVIEKGITSIGNYAFYQSPILSVFIPDGVTSIGESAFEGSTLVAATIPGSVATIGNNAFKSCTNMTSATIEDGVRTIGDYAFWGCSALQYADFPGTVTSIGLSAFQGCTEMVSLRFKPGTETVTVKDSAFAQCQKLTDIVLPLKLANISNYMFQSCTSIYEIYIPGTITSIGSLPFSSSLMQRYGGTIYFGGSSDTWTSIGGGSLKTTMPLVTVKCDVSFDNPFAGGADANGGLGSDGTDPCAEGHTGEDDGTGLCTVCGKPIASEPDDPCKDGNHSWTDGVCDDCGEVCDHDGADEGTCATCGKVLSTTPVDPDPPAPENPCKNGHVGVDDGTGHCTECGELLESEPDDPCEDGHAWLDGECTVCHEICNHGGADTGTCSTCGKVLSTGPDNPDPPVIDPDPGNHEHEWSTTSWSNDSSYHWRECGASNCPITSNSEKGSYGAHNYGGWITDVSATSTQSGSRHRICASCGYRQNGTIPATGGTTNPPVNPDPPVIKDPCEENGHRWVNGECTVCHKTCNHGGASEGICSICNKTLSTTPVDPDPPVVDNPCAEGHTGEDDGTGLCTVCGKPIASEPDDPCKDGNHTWTDGVCDDCGEICDHDGADEGTCATCGKVLSTTPVDPNPPMEENPCQNGHVGVDDGTGHCTECGELLESEPDDPCEENGHEWSNGVCNVCHKSCDHNGAEEGNCSICGKTLGATNPIDPDPPTPGNPCENGHVGKDDGTGHCTECGELLETEPNPPAHKHIWSTSWAHNATSHWHECVMDEGCDLVNNSDKDGYASHVFGGWIIRVYATSTQSGSRARECTVCGYQQTEVIPATGTTSSGGGSSGGSSSSSSSRPSSSKPSSTTTTPVQPAGPTTTTSTNPTTGIKTETVTQPDGSRVVTSTRPDGIVSTVATDASGKNKTEVKLPTTIINGATNKPVNLPISAVHAGFDASRATPITIVTENGESVKVAIPALVSSKGAVAMIVHDDGTLEPIRTSVVRNNSVIATIPSGTTVKIVDCSKNFTDVSTGHWAKDAVDAVSARGLLSGTKQDTFSPDVAMTRAMMLTVLARLDGVNTEGGDTWYAKSLEWAKARGISDGSNVNQDITREQLAVMLWRYAGSPAVTKTPPVRSDTNQVSDYARDAMDWAVLNGIITGFADGHLGPQEGTTRAQAAQMLMNFISIILNPEN